MSTTEYATKLELSLFIMNLKASPKFRLFNLSQSPSWNTYCRASRYSRGRPHLPISQSPHLKFSLKNSHELLIFQ